MLKCILLGDTFEYILLPCNMVISRGVLYTVIDVCVGPPNRLNVAELIPG